MTESITKIEYDSLDDTYDDLVDSVIGDIQSRKDYLEIEEYTKRELKNARTLEAVIGAMVDHPHIQRGILESIEKDTPGSYWSRGISHSDTSAIDEIKSTQANGTINRISTSKTFSEISGMSKVLRIALVDLISALDEGIVQLGQSNGYGLRIRKPKLSDVGDRRFQEWCEKNIDLIDIDTLD